MKKTMLLASAAMIGVGFLTAHANAQGVPQTVEITKVDMQKVAAGYRGSKVIVAASWLFVTIASSSLTTRLCCRTGQRTGLRCCLRSNTLRSDCPRVAGLLPTVWHAEELRSYAGKLVAA